MRSRALPATVRRHRLKAADETAFNGGLFRLTVVLKEGPNVVQGGVVAYNLSAALPKIYFKISITVTIDLLASSGTLIFSLRPALKFKQKLKKDTDQ